MSKKIMVIDDSISVRKLLVNILNHDGYETLEGVDGQDAIQKLSNKTVDLILCDIYMPNMDGLAFVEEFKSIPENQTIPVVMLTTEDTEEKKIIGMEAGANAWITKPFNPEQLLNLVGRLIK
jgi:two-component system chemotaxis response regulator CheY